MEGRGTYINQIDLKGANAESSCVGFAPVARDRICLCQGLEAVIDLHDSRGSAVRLQAARGPIMTDAQLFTSVRRCSGFSEGCCGTSRAMREDLQYAKICAT